MNVVGIISSANHSGNSAALVRAALRAASAEGARVSEVFLPDWKIEFCQGCLRCLAAGRCHQDDQFEELRHLLIEADGIVLGTPTFGAAPNARMKNMFDRLGMFERFTSSLGGKYVVALSTASSPAAARKVAKALAAMAAGGVFRRGYISGTLGAKAMPQGQPVTAGTVARAEALGRRLVADFRRRNVYPLQNLAARLVSSLVVRPLFRKAVIDYKDGMLKGVYANLRERGLVN